MVSEPLFLTNHALRFSTALGVTDAWSAYEYLMDGETDGVDRWDDFNHVPDLSEEQQRKQQIDARIARDKRRFENESMLLLEHSRSGSRRTKAIVTADRSGLGFLACWSDDGESVELESVCPPWNGFVPYGLQLAPNIFVMKPSESGQYLATGHASGTWKTTLWDLKKKRMLAEIDQSRLINWVQFAADEHQLVSLSENVATITEIPSGRLLTAIETNKLQGGYLTGAIHQQSHTLVIGGELGISIIDLNSGKCLREFPVVKRDPMLLVREHLDGFGLDFGDLAPEEVTLEILNKVAAKQLGEQFGDELASQLRTDELTRRRWARGGNRFHPSSTIHARREHTLFLAIRR